MPWLTVREVMTAGVTSVDLDATVESIQNLFEHSPFHHVVVIDDDHRVAGVISDRDLLRHLSPFIGKMAERAADLACLQRRAHQIMTRRPATVRAGSLVADAASLMLNRRFSCMPVVDQNGRPIGIVTLRDVAGWATETLRGAA
ncbi:MAG: CBS domain-containing protein [Planctomycetota bacterium]